MNRATLCAGTACVGAAGMYLLDPRLGRRRRHELRDRSLGMLRRSWRRSLRTERTVAMHAHGRLLGMLHRHEPPRSYDDVTLAHKVESVIYRDRQVPKGRLN